MIMLIAFLFVALLGRLIYIEVVVAKDLQAKALDQWMRDVPLQAERGAIYDRNGILLADSTTTYTVYVRPTSCDNKDVTAFVLSQLLGLEFEDLREDLNSKVSEITVMKNVDKTTVMQLVGTSATGIYVGTGYLREYPYGDFLTQVLGFTNVDGVGQTGVEYYYNDYLTGQDGYILTETDLIGRELDSNTTYYVDGTSGSDMYLTIDYYIQSFAQTAVEDAMSTYSAAAASCIVMDIDTGEILALAEAPSFDLNDIPRDDIATLLTSSSISSISTVFEPGSTFKILTSAIGLETGAVSLDTTTYCDGCCTIDGECINCWRSTGHGTQTFAEGVQNSCNVLFMETALAIGTETFYDYIDLFGLTSLTGIDLSGETSGLTIAEASVKNVDLARIGFGQAIAVTPIELITACASVVNGGNLVTPYITSSIVSSTGSTVYSATPQITSGIISSETSEIMRELLQSVVDEGSGSNAAVNGYAIGGKTGTAQKYENGVIAEGKYISTFLGFAPADDPEYIVLMVVDEPQGAYYGSIVAAPYVGDVFEKIFNYTGLEPSWYTSSSMMIMPDIVGMDAASAAAILDQYGLYYEIEGESGVVTKQVPVAGSLISSSSVALMSMEV
ncbi:MAG: penicillin-binding transpeptidase domain-containing protein [Bacillota bacterium]